MSEQEVQYYEDNELLSIIDSCLAVIATLSEIDKAMMDDDERADIDVIKRNTYRIIFAAQKKLLKSVKDN